MGSHACAPARSHAPSPPPDSNLRQRKAATAIRAATTQRAPGALSAREKPRRPLGPACRAAKPRRVGLAARDRPSQRERERERRVSDADASYYGPISDTRTPKHV